MISFNSVSLNRYGLLRINTLSNRRYLITGSTMQGLCLDDYEWGKWRRGWDSNPRSPKATRALQARLIGHSSTSPQKVRSQIINSFNFARWRRGWDSNPRSAKYGDRFSRAAPSTTRTPLLASNSTLKPPLQASLATFWRHFRQRPHLEHLVSLPQIGVLLPRPCQVTNGYRYRRL